MNHAQQSPPFVYAALLALFALALLVPGIQLARLGGSPYYLLAGIALAGSAGLLARGSREGVCLYGAIVLATLTWAIWEVGFDGWALMPRLAAWLVVGSWMLLPSWRLRLTTTKSRASFIARAATGHGFAVAAVVAVFLGALLRLANPPPPDPRFQTGEIHFPERGAAADIADAGEWRQWGRDGAGNRFSPLTQIRPDNVADLTLAWRTPIAMSKAGWEAGVEATPLMIGDTLFTCNGVNEIFALDADTGKIRWQVQTAGEKGHNCRGVAYFKTQDSADAPCSERILAATGIATLVALDAHTGHFCHGFGDGGVVNLKEGLSKAPRGYYFVTSAPAVVRGRVVVGGWVTDGQFWGEPSGVVRAFDVLTGKLSWAWDVGQPDRVGLPPEGATYTPSTPNSWAPIGVDEATGTVYLPMGNSVPDYFGGSRRPFDDQYSSSVTALDAETGRPRWSFQTTHHDLWDYDVASQPLQVDLPTPGGAVEPALVQMTKRGEVFVLDRSTGRPIRPVFERPAPQGGGVAEDRHSPTQPFSTGMPSFRGPDVRESDMWGLTPLDQLVCRIRFREARYEGTLTPPGVTPWIESPGMMGGMDWGSGSIDPDHHVLVVMTNRIVDYDRLVPRAQADARGDKPLGDDESVHGGGGPQVGTPYAADVGFFLSPLFIPCQAPPYGYISAVDLVSGKLIWSRPLGTARDTGPLGIASHLPLPLGTFVIGGSMTTRSGLIFAGATADRTFRALDLRSGKELWHDYLPHGGFATPMTYISPHSGRQFVVIASSSLYRQGQPAGAELMAYSLPRPRN